MTASPYPERSLLIIQYYTLFERNAVGKTVFDLESEQIMRAKG